MFLLQFLLAQAPLRFQGRFTYENSRLAEGVGLLPTNRKALKINGRFRRYVSQDYRTSVPVGKGELFIRN